MGKFLKDELLALLEKAKAGNATGDDYARIAAIINADQTGELISQVENFLAHEGPVSSTHIDPYNYDYWQRAFLEIKETYKQHDIQNRNMVQNRGAVKRMFNRRGWLVAASIIVLLSVGAYLLTKPTSPPIIAGSTEILPGKDGAILTLANGSQILLDTIQNGVVALQGGATAKIVNDTLIYEGGGSEAVYNIMSTPKARKFHVILPDGTKAWLNSASSIQYPTAFKGNERKVTVAGEVYFEVATLRQRSGQKVKFKVNVNNKAEIEVLGTHFNVKAYENESVINTTLLEGSIAISISPNDNGQAARQQVSVKDKAKTPGKLILKPGQQAQITVGENRLLVNGEQPQNRNAQKATGKENPSGITVIDSDVDKVMAWKNNVFDFNNIAFDDAMYQLERWYDIQVVYENGIPADVELNGKMTKDVTLNELVTILQQIGVKCRLEGRKLLIQS